MTKIINLYGAPGSGKSTIASGLFFHMKMAGLNVELATEYAKSKLFEENTYVFKDQLYCFSKQHKKLREMNGKVDYIITHTGPDDILKIGMSSVAADPTSRYLNSIMHNVEFKHWYFGHMHIDKTILNKYSFLYNKIIPLGDSVQ